MCSHFVFVVIACLSVISTTQAGDIAADIVGLRECCPSLPVLVNEKSVVDCLQAVDGKQGYHMFGGSVPTTRSCALECAFKSENLLSQATPGIQPVDLTAVDSQLSMVANPNWSDVLTAAKKNCTSNPPNITATSTNQQCTSGAYEVSVCLYRFMMSSCPSIEVGKKSDCTTRLNNMSLNWFQRIMKRWFGKKTTTTTTTTTTTSSA